MIRLDTVQAVSIVGKIKVMSLVLDGIERLCVDNAVFSFWKDGRGRARQEDKCRFFGCHLDLLMSFPGHILQFISLFRVPTHVSEVCLGGVPEKLINRTGLGEFAFGK